jgi:hypothetical protein
MAPTELVPTKKPREPKAIDVYGSAIEYANLLEEEARTYYAICVGRSGRNIAWEHLLEQERAGFRDLVEYVRAAPECSCGTGLMCPDCDRAELRGLLAELDGENPVYAETAPRACRVCGCTDDNPCAGGCGWAGEDLCTNCVDKVPALYSEGEMNAYIAALKAVAP